MRSLLKGFTKDTKFTSLLTILNKIVCLLGGWDCSSVQRTVKGPKKTRYRRGDNKRSDIILLVLFERHTTLP